MEPGSLISELKRRRVFRVLVGYGIVAFAVLQIIEPVMHALHLSDVTLTYVVLALAVGFPVAVMLAWAFDVKDGRIERAPPAGSSALRGARLRLVLVGIGVLAAAPGTVWYFMLRSRSAAPSGDEALRAKLDAVPPASDIRSPPSIAVLPFVNLSSDKEQEYFSDGIAEEILNALAQVEGLHVVGRTSSFYFKGKNEDLASIAAKLHVATLLEGSVRKSGDRVRITAQLINAADGFHLWSKQFDRELTDIFKVQGELAAAVVEALKVKLLPGSARPIHILPSRDPEAYRLFLLGRALQFQQTSEADERAQAALEKSLALDPAYAPAWQWLAAVRGDRAQVASPNQAEALVRSAREAAERAIEADPADGVGYAVRSWIRSNMLWDWTGAKRDIERAQALAPSSEFTLNVRALLLAKLGKPAEAVPLLRKAIEADPLDTIVLTNLGSVQSYAGQYPAARETLQRALELAPQSQLVAQQLALLELRQSHPEQALAWFEKVTSEADRLTGQAVAHHDLHHPAESRRALEALTEAGQRPQPFHIAQVHAWRGEADEAFRWLDRAYAQHDLGLRNVKVDPLLRNLRGDPRYTALLKKMKLPAD